MTPLATSSDYRALLAAICAQPSEDTPRLALADWLDENGGTVVCAKCKGEGKVKRRVQRKFQGATRNVTGFQSEWDRILKCPACLGSGRVPDANTARAEFIRVQCELARPATSPGTWNQPELRARSDALLLAHESEWRRGERCSACEDGKIEVFCGADRVRYERWMGKQYVGNTKVACPDCHGIGWTGPLAAVRRTTGGRREQDEITGWRYPATFERGFVAEVHAPLADVFGPDDKPTAWAVRLVRAEPVQRLVISDYPAWQCDERRWSTMGDSDAFRPHPFLPWPLYHAMKAETDGSGWCDSEADATLALATAAANLVRTESEHQLALELAAAR